MNVKTLKRVLQTTLDSLEDKNDDAKIRLESNTYFVNGAKYFLGVSGFDGGYLDLDNIDVDQGDEDYMVCDKCGGDIIWDENGYHGICNKCGDEV